MEECLIFGHIVGAGLKYDLQGVLELVSFGGGEDDSGARTLVGFGPVEVESPPLLVLGWLGQLCLLPVDEEISECLRLDGHSWLEVQLERSEFHRLLCNPPDGVPIVEYVPDRETGDHRNWMRLEVVN